MTDKQANKLTDSPTGGKRQTGRHGKTDIVKERQTDPTDITDTQTKRTWQRDRQRHKHTQTGITTNVQTDRHSRETVKHNYIQTHYTQAGRHTNTNRQAERPTERQTERHGSWTDRQSDRQTDRQTYRQTKSHRQPKRHRERQRDR